MTTTRKSAPKISLTIPSNSVTEAAGTAGEKVTITAGDTVLIRWAGYGGVRGSEAIHDTEAAANRDELGRYTTAVVSDYTDAKGKGWGVALKLIGAEAKPTNRHAVTNRKGEVIGRMLPVFTSRGVTSQLVAVLPK